MAIGFMQDFQLFMNDDMELLRAANAQWAVVPMTDQVHLFFTARMCIPGCSGCWSEGVLDACHGMF